MHKYPLLYKQCEDTTGYDDLIRRLGRYQSLPTKLDIDCRRGGTTMLTENALTEIYNELLDYLDGNGFVIKRFNNSFNNKIIYIIPIEKENIK